MIKGRMISGYPYLQPIHFAHKSTSMKLIALLLITVMALSGQTGCKNGGNTDNATTGTETPTANPSTEGNDAALNADEARERVSSQFAAQFGRMGIELTPEQLQQVEAIAAKYDFASAADRESRRAMRQEFQKEVFDAVLTEEQRNSANLQREEVKSNRKEEE